MVFIHTFLIQQDVFFYYCHCTEAFSSFFNPTRQHVFYVFCHLRGHIICCHLRGYPTRQSIHIFHHYHPCTAAFFSFFIDLMQQHEHFSLFSPTDTSVPPPLSKRGSGEKTSEQPEQHVYSYLFRISMTTPASFSDVNICEGTEYVRLQMAPLRKEKTKLF